MVERIKDKEEARQEGGECDLEEEEEKGQHDGTEGGARQEIEYKLMAEL